jgi:hypothetical protein
VKTNEGAIGALAEALAKAQAEVQGATKDSENPFFGSRYADLASVWAACRKALTDHGLSVVQAPSTSFTGEPETYTYTTKRGEERSGIRVATTVTVTTRILHATGAWIEAETSAMLPSADPQAVGSAITYLRRYGLASMVGVAPEDDDGEATARPVPAAQRPAHVDQDGVVRLPGNDKSWGGNGGKPLTEVPSSALVAAEKWLREKDAKKNTATCEAITEELERRRLAEEPKAAAPDFTKEPPALMGAEKAADDDAGLPF